MAVDGPPNKSALKEVDGVLIDNYAKAVAALDAALAYFSARSGKKEGSDDNAD
jgi:glucose-6-phosphate dehydrogenase assembly protein OpcA